MENAYKTITGNFQTIQISPATWSKAHDTILRMRSIHTLNNDVNLLSKQFV